MSLEEYMEFKYYEDILGKTSRCDIKFGTPLQWNLIE